MTIQNLWLPSLAETVPEPVQSTILAAYAGNNNPSGVATFATDTGLDITAASDYCAGSSGGNNMSWTGITSPNFGNWVGKGYRMCIGVNMAPDGYWTPHGGNTTTTLQNGTNGDYNSFFTTFGNFMVAHGFADAILRIGWEFGGNQPWSPVSSADPPLYATFWQQIVTTLRAVSGQQFLFDWNPLWGFYNFSEINAYPGDAYVDIISTDIYDNSYNATIFPPNGQPGNHCTTAQSNAQWNDMMTTPNNPLGGWMSMAQSHGKYFAAPEWGVNNDGGGASGHGLGDDPQFITNFNNMVKGSPPDYTGTPPTVYYISYFAFDYGSPGSSNCFNITDGLFPNALARMKSLTW